MVRADGALLRTLKIDKENVSLEVWHTVSGRPFSMSGKASQGRAADEKNRLRVNPGVDIQR